MAPDARVQHAVSAGNGPCGNFYAAGGGAATGGARNRLPEAGARGIRTARMEVEGRERGENHAADAADWRELRLVTGEIHAFAGNVARSARSVCAVVRGEIDLPRDAAGELVPGLFDGAE